MSKEVLVKEIKAELKSLGVAEKAEFFPRFFKTGKGEYGEGDQFWGVTVPNIRLVVKKYYPELSLDDVQSLLYDVIHEVRLFAAMSLAAKFKKADAASQKEIFDFYIKHSRQMNNWDIVDSSAQYVVGAYLLKHPEEVSILDKLSDSENLWQNRIAIVATWQFIREKKFTETLKLARKFLTHKHDLIHKATGWMLREMYKREEQPLLDFLDKYSRQMPRTMLRYTIERLPEEQRKKYMALK